MLLSLTIYIDIEDYIVIVTGDFTQKCFVSDIMMTAVRVTVAVIPS